MPRSVLVALVASIAVAIGCTMYLAVHQAPSGDETLTIAQTRDPTLDTLRRTYDHPEPPPAPPAYYLLAWAVGETPDGVPLRLRTMSVLGWGVASLSLGLILVRRGGGPASVFAAGCGISASGLVFQGMAARPYGLTAGALALALALWNRSLRGPTAGTAVGLGAALVAAVSLHYWAVTVVPCVLVAELWARRIDPARPRAFLASIAVGAAPLLVLAASIVRTIEVERNQIHPVAPWLVPAFYLSMIRPLLVPLALFAIVVLVLGALGGGMRHVAEVLGRSPGPALRSLARDPLVVLVGLLALTVPLQVAVVARLLNGAYLHRYAIAGLLGLVLAGAGVVRLIERRVPVVAAAAAVAVALGTPFSVAAATRESPTVQQVDAAVRVVTGEADGATVVVPEPYLYALIRRGVPAAKREQVVLAGPSQVPGDTPAFDLYRAPERPIGSTRVLLVADGADLGRFRSSGRITSVRPVGTFDLDYESNQRRFQVVLVDLVPA